LILATSLKASRSPSAVRSELARMRNLRFVTIGFAALLSLSACDDVLNDDEESMHTRMVNLIEDSPTVQYKIDTTVVGSASYQGVTALNTARPGSHAVSFGAIRPTTLVSSDTTDPIELPGSFTQSYSQDRDYTIVTYGTLADVKTLVIDDPSDKGSLEDDFIEIRFLNIAPNVPSMDVLIRAPEGNINTPDRLGTIALGASTSARSIKLFRRADVTDTNAALFTDLTIEVRDPATGTLLFKSAELRISEQTRLLFAVTKNVGPGPSPIQLMGLDGISGINSEPDDRAAVRIVHVSPDTPPLDIIRASSLSTPLAENLAFRDRTDYVTVPNGDVDLIAQPADANSAIFLFLEEFSASPGLSYSAYAVGPLASVDAQVLIDDRRKVPTQAKFRFYNAAPNQIDQDGYDIYLTVPGQTIDFDSTDDTNTADDAAQFRRGTGVLFKGVTDSFTYKGGAYQVRVMDAGTSRVVLDTPVTLVEGTVQTFVLIDSEEGALELMPVDEAL
jgi:hypothetical protein